MKLLHTREPSPTIRMWRTAKSAGNGSTRRAARAFCVSSSSGCRVAPTFDCVTIEKASGTAAVDPDFAALNPGYLLEAETRRGTGRAAATAAAPSGLRLEASMVRRPFPL